MGQRGDMTSDLSFAGAEVCLAHEHASLSPAEPIRFAHREAENRFPKRLGIALRCPFCPGFCRLVCLSSLLLLFDVPYGSHLTASLCVCLRGLSTHWMLGPQNSSNSNCCLARPRTLSSCAGIALLRVSAPSRGCALWRPTATALYSSHRLQPQHRGRLGASQPPAAHEAGIRSATQSEFGKMAKRVRA